MTRRRTARTAALLGVGTAVLLLSAAPASAHPLGNFSVNTFSGLRVQPDAVQVEVVVDKAEIPTRQESPELDPRTGTLPAPALERLKRDACAGVLSTVELSVDGDDVPLLVVGTEASFPPGAAGLRTTRLTCSLTHARPVRTVDRIVDYRISANAGNVGWREVVAVPDGVRFTSADVPETSVSDALRNYPTDLLSSPLDQRSARISVVRGTGVVSGANGSGRGVAAALPRGADRLTEAFTGLVSRERLSIGFGLLAVGAAVLLGGLHAFAPGHGKTVMAAYLMGERGSFRDVAFLGLAVTATHTAGVLALGLLLTGAHLASPERVYPWLGVASGLLLAGIGVTLLRRARRAGRREHGEAHPPGEVHSHGGVPHSHAPRPGRRGLLAVGFAGGLVPSPSALLVLLGGIALGRTWFGVLLVLAYGVGMAAALAGTGLALVRARATLERFLHRPAGTARRRPVVARLGRLVPTATAAVVIVVGAGVALRSLAVA